MANAENHQMVLVTTHPSSAEEWYCPTCGFRFIMTWPPNYRRIILEEGDPEAKHSGGKGDVTIGVQVTQMPEENSLSKEIPEAKDNSQDSMGDDEHLGPWQQWMEDTDYDNLWSKKIDD